MKRFSLFSLICLSLACVSNGYDLFPEQKEFEYNIETGVVLGAIPNTEDEKLTIAKNEWKVSGKLVIQRQSPDTLAVVFKPSKVIVFSGIHFNETNSHEIEEHATPILLPFKVVLGEDGIVTSVVFKTEEPVWSANIKRSIAYALQVREDTESAYVVDENGLYGNCRTDYYVTKGPKTSLKVTKTPILETCTVGSHTGISILPTNPCNKDYQENVVVSNEGQYILGLNGDYKQIHIIEAKVKSYATVYTFAPTGEGQFISSELKLSKGVINLITKKIDIETDMSSASTLDYEQPDPKYRLHFETTYVELAKRLFSSFIKDSENKVPNLLEPYHEEVANLFQIFALMDKAAFDELHEFLYEPENQEYHSIYTRLFVDLLQRTGTKASVSFIKDLLVKNNFTDAELLLIIPSIPFYLTEPSTELVETFEILFNLDADHYSKYIRRLGLLSFSSIVFKTYEAKKMPTETFEKYVKKYLDAYQKATEYSEKMLYIEALANLQLGSVYESLVTIIQNQEESDDLRFLAISAAMPMAPSHDKTFEVFWPIFVKPTNSLQLRVMAFSTLLTSNPTAGRLMSIHRVMQEEKCKHLINFYRTTVLSIVKSTNPCFEQLSRSLSFMERHLPIEPPQYFWVTGNYMFDYKDEELQTGGVVQASLIGNEKNDAPMSVYLKLQMEALGKFTNQFGLYIKTRGVSSGFYGELDVSKGLKFEKLVEILQSMNMHLTNQEPLHAEIILQYGGKAILSNVFSSDSMDQQYIYLLFSELLQFFTHIDDYKTVNVGMPYFSKYHVPTVFGTPIDVDIQETYFNYLGVNASSSKKLAHVYFDYRYASYLSCDSLSYNPFLKLTHGVERQQGSMFYVPLNLGAEILPEDKLQLSHTRPKEVISGYSMDSRTVLVVVGDTVTHISEDREKNDDEKTEFEFDFDDLGVSFALVFSEENIKNYLRSMTDSDTTVNTHVLDDGSDMDYHLRLLSAMQIDSLNFGADKNFKFVFMGKNDSYTTYTFSSRRKDPENYRSYGYSMVMNHMITENSPVLHEWNVDYIFSYEPKTKYNIESYYKRVDHTGNKATFLKDFRYCSNLSYYPKTFLEKPEVYEYSASFGGDSKVEKCADDFVKFSVRMSQDRSPVNKTVNFEEIELNDECPVDILKFKPPVYDEICTKKELQTYSSYSHYTFNVRYENLPEEVYPIIERISYTVSAFLPDKLELLNITHGFDLVLHESSEDILELEVNSRVITIPNFLRYYDSMPDISYKSDEVEYIDYGFIRSCSIIKDRLNTFNEEIVSLKDFLPTEDKRDTCSTLLVADCSKAPTFAVFLESVVEENIEEYTYKLRVYTGGHYVHLVYEDNKMYVLEGKKCYDVNTTSYAYPRYNDGSSSSSEETYEQVYNKLKIYQSEEGIYVVGHDKFTTKIQFNGKNVISVLTPGFYMGQTCGLCSYPTHYKKDHTNFTYCGHHATHRCGDNEV